MVALPIPQENQLVATPFYAVDNDSGAPCGRPMIQEPYYGMDVDPDGTYWERCEEPILWDMREGDIVWCAYGHEWELARA